MKMEIVKVEDNSVDFVEYSAFEYVLIAIANAYGLDKENFPTRIATIRNSIDNLWDYVDSADEPMMYQSHLYQLEKIKRGEPVGMRVALDAVNSGTQIIAALMGCEQTSSLVGMVYPNKRSDAYNELQDQMNTYEGINACATRVQLKEAFMPWNYGSDQNPKDVFGDGSPEHIAFIRAINDVLPACPVYRSALINAWNPKALTHKWTRPDGFVADVKVLKKVSHSIEVKGLGSFTHIVEVNQPIELGEEGYKALSAHVVQGLDAMICAEIQRRCNYDKDEVNNVLTLIELVLVSKGIDPDTVETDSSDFLATNYITAINESNIKYYNVETLVRAYRRLKDMTKYEPFEVLTTHDEFSCLPSKMNTVRYWYKELLAELAESHVLEDIYYQLTGKKVTINKSKRLPELIRRSNYCLS